MPRLLRLMPLPEEVVDRVEHFSGVDVDEQHVVIIADPFGARFGRRQAILPGVADPVALIVEERIEEDADREAVIAVAAIGRIIRPEVEEAAVAVAVALPIVAIVVAPVPVPIATAAIVAAPVSAVVAIVAPPIAAVVAPPVAAVTIVTL